MAYSKPINRPTHFFKNEKNKFVTYRIEPDEYKVR